MADDEGWRDEVETWLIENTPGHLARFVESDRLQATAQRIHQRYYRNDQERFASTMRAFLAGPPQAGNGENVPRPTFTVSSFIKAVSARMYGAPWRLEDFRTATGTAANLNSHRATSRFLLYTTFKRLWEDSGSEEGFHTVIKGVFDDSFWHRAQQEGGYFQERRLVAVKTLQDLQESRADYLANAYHKAQTNAEFFWDEMSWRKSSPHGTVLVEFLACIGRTLGFQVSLKASFSSKSFESSSGANLTSPACDTMEVKITSSGRRSRSSSSSVPQSEQNVKCRPDLAFRKQVGEDTIVVPVELKKPNCVGLGEAQGDLPPYVSQAELSAMLQSSLSSEDIKKIEASMEECVVSATYDQANPKKTSLTDFRERASLWQILSQMVYAQADTGVLTDGVFFWLLRLQAEFQNKKVTSWTVKVAACTFASPIVRPGHLFAWALKTAGKGLWPSVHIMRKDGHVAAPRTQEELEELDISSELANLCLPAGGGCNDDGGAGGAGGHSDEDGSWSGEPKSKRRNVRSQPSQGQSRQGTKKSVASGKQQSGRAPACGAVLPLLQTPPSALRVQSAPSSPDIVPAQADVVERSIGEAIAAGRAGAVHAYSACDVPAVIKLACSDEASIREITNEARMYECLRKAPAELRHRFPEFLGASGAPRHCILLEKLEGAPLSALGYLDRLRAVPTLDLILHAMWRFGMSHGDVAWRNLFVNTAGQVYMLDLGRAALRTECSPKQWRTLKLKDADRRDRLMTEFR